MMVDLVILGLVVAARSIYAGLLVATHINKGRERPTSYIRQDEKGEN